MYKTLTFGLFVWIFVIFCTSTSVEGNKFKKYAAKKGANVMPQSTNNALTMAQILKNQAPKSSSAPEPVGKPMSPDIFDRILLRRQYEAAGEVKQKKIQETEEILSSEGDLEEDSENPTVLNKVLDLFTARRVNGGRNNKKAQAKRTRADKVTRRPATKEQVDEAKIENEILKSQSDKAYYETLIKDARCPDLFSIMDNKNNKYPDNRPWSDRIPVYNVGLFQVRLSFDLRESGKVKSKGFTPLEYSEETKSICNGSSGRHDDICELTCPNLTPPVPYGQLDNDNDGKSNQFKCVCSLNTEKPEDYVCFWRPVEKKWKRYYTCDTRKKMARAPVDTFNLVTWWNASPHSENRWSHSVEKFSEFLQTPADHSAADTMYKSSGSILKAKPMDVNLYEKRPDNFNSLHQEENGHDDFKNVKGEASWSEETKQKLSEALENDSQYQILKTKLDSLNSIEDKNEMQRFEHQKFKKMTHLGELIAHYQLIGSGQEQNSMGSPKLFENFFKYGCYCLQGDNELHKGIGHTKDPIDSACKEHDICVKCAGLDNNDGPKKCHPYRGYQFSLETISDTIEHKCYDQDPEDTDKNNANSCRKTLCECDKMFVQKLLDYKDIYDSNLHYGSFDSSAQCFSNCRIDPETEKCFKYDACCNDENGKRKPFVSFEGKKKCCEDGSIAEDC